MLILSVYLRPKVITLSGFLCTYFDLSRGMSDVLGTAKIEIENEKVLECNLTESSLSKIPTRGATTMQMRKRKNWRNLTRERSKTKI
jgi:hypothetical protein